MSLDEALEIHKQLIKRFGGLDGIRDMGLLESALFRAKSGYYRDILEISAAMFESLIKNHPFVDGNKRVAFFATDVFLRLNGYKFDVVATDAHQFLYGLLENKRCDLEHLHPWIRASVTEIKIKS